MKYAKALVAGGAVLIALGHALLDGSVSPQEWGEILVAGATAFGVYAVPNRPA